MEAIVRTTADKAICIYLNLLYLELVVQYFDPKSRGWTLRAPAMKNSQAANH